MADSKVTALTATTAPLKTDIFYIVTDPSGTPASKKVTLADAKKSIVTSVADATSITPNVDTSNIVSQTNTQAAGTLTFNAPSGTPVDGQSLLIRVISTNAQTNSWNAAYSGSLPGSTAVGTNYYSFIYYSTGSIWHYTGGAGI